MARARQLDEQKTDSPLRGVPLTIKDNIFLGGFATTDASESFSDFVPSTNAEVVDRLLRAGCVPLGKTNLHEFALGVTGTSALGGPIRNPVEPSRISGGSSGGSAVSVALAKGPLLSLGSDTGGSVRIPAALCGVCGFKPSWGSLSTAGVFPLSASLDHVGLLAKSVPDVSGAFSVLTGTAPAKKKRWRLGVPTSYFVEDMDEHVSKSFWSSVDLMRADGRFAVRELRVSDDYRLYPRARAAIMCREAGWFYEPVLKSEESRKTVHKDVLSLMDWGMSIGMLQYMRSLNLRTECTARMTALVGELDAVIMPTCLVIAPTLEEAMGKETGRLRPLLLRNTELFNMSGLPALSLPMRRNRSGLPTGLQVVGAPGRDAEVLGAAEAVWSVLHARERRDA